MSKIRRIQPPQKPPPLVAPRQETPENVAQIELELCWCVQQLETALASGKLSKKVADDTVKNLRTLKSSTAPLVKKRQIMKTALGDYRAKMKEEEKKLALAAAQIKFTKTIEDNKKSSFLKKSAIMQTGKDFRFNFEAPTSNDADGTTPMDVKQTQPSRNENGVFISKDLNLTSGGDFKFNFVVEENNEELNLNSLAINS
ncbi:UPF0488 protein CG14286 [Eurosta solidaginis]|uniref:UPF0488 protein CG14286 n=1 Tax=Eurosta solidaginis TaxID=178769 RepID=UPI003531702A